VFRRKQFLIDRLVVRTPKRVETIFPFCVFVNWIFFAKANEKNVQWQSDTIQGYVVAVAVIYERTFSFYIFLFVTSRLSRMRIFCRPVVQWTTSTDYGYTIRYADFQRRQYAGIFEKQFRSNSITATTTSTVSALLYVRNIIGRIKR